MNDQDGDLLTLTDDELAELALAADPDAPVDADAVPMGSLDGELFPSLLPSWYMPIPAAGFRSRRRAVVAAVIIISILAINALGMCITSGFLELP